MANLLNIWNNPYTQDIVKGHSQAMYDGPNAIVNTTSGGLDYHTRANADLSNRISSELTESGNPIAAGVYDFMAPAGAFGASLGYDLGQGVTRYGEKPGDYLSDFQQDVKSWQDNPDLDKGVKSALAGKGITDYSGVDLMGTTNAWMDEKPFSAAFGRMLGAAEPLANRLGFFGQQYDEDKDTIDPSDPRFTQQMIMDRRATQKGIAQAAMQKKIQQAEAAAAQQAAANAAAAGQRRAGRGGSHMSRSRDQGGLGISRAQAQSISDANRAAGMSGWGLADGGLAYLLYGGLV